MRASRPSPATPPARYVVTMTTRRYKHILIDADNTILNFSVCEKRILENMARDFGFMPWTIDGEDLTTAYRRINGTLWRALERGEIAPDELKIERFRQLAELLNFTAISRPVPPEILNRQFIQRLSTCGELVPTARTVLEKLAPVTVITNGFADVQRPRFAATGLEPCIDHVFISEDIGVAKPDPAFFDAVVSALGNPERSECLVIGDSLTSDIAGGNAAGMDTVWFDRRVITGESTQSDGEAKDAPSHPATFRITRLVQLYDIVFVR